MLAHRVNKMLTTVLWIILIRNTPIQMINLQSKTIETSKTIHYMWNELKQ